MTHEIQTLQRINETLTQDNARLLLKHDSLTDAHTQRLQEIDRLRKQVTD